MHENIMQNDTKLNTNHTPKPSFCSSSSKISKERIKF